MKFGIFSIMKFLAGLAVCLVLILPGIHLEANNIRDIQQQQQEVRQEIRATLNQITNTQAQMALVTAEIQRLDADLEEAAIKLDVANQALIDAEDRLARTQDELDMAQQNLDDQVELFRTQLRVMHEHGNIGLLEVVFQATSVQDFLWRLEHINSIAQQNQRMVEELEAAEAEVAQAIVNILREEGLLQAFRIQQESHIEAIEVLLMERYIFFEELSADEAGALLIYEMQRDAERQIQAALEEAQRQEARRLAEAQQRAQTQQRRDLGNLNGIFLWPTPDSFRVTSDYGNRTHPISRRQEFHTGIDIGAPTGTPILAAYSGEVILASWNGGFGQTVIIYHGDGLSTLYAHNSRNLVQVGQRVERGQRIALVGSTGQSTGPHLHFEVRVDGRHVDPWPFLRE